VNSLFYGQGCNVNRRHFLSKLGWTSFWTAVVGMVAGLARSMYPNVLYEPSRKYKVGYPADFARDVVTPLPGEKLFIYNDSKQGFYAISGICTHLGCVVSKTQEGFFCPCHGSRFDHSGKVKAGPAPRPLPWYRVSLALDGQLVVDAGEEVKPGTTLPI